MTRLLAMLLLVSVVAFARSAHVVRKTAPPSHLRQQHHNAGRNHTPQHKHSDRVYVSPQTGKHIRS